MLSDDDIRRAAYLHEGALPDAEQRERWCSVVAGGDPAKFEKRLEWGFGGTFRPPDLDWVPVAEQIAKSSPVLVAQKLLETRSSAVDVLSTAAQRQLQLWLIKRLNRIAGPGVVAARLTATLVVFWVDAVAAFLERLDADRTELQSLLGLGDFTVDQVVPGLSDSHYRGNSVITVTFAQGTRVVYKPKSLYGDVAFQHVLDWWNSRTFSLRLRTLRILPRNGYGWMEYVGTSSSDSVDPRRLAHRAGMLAALLYALRVTDCHYENVLADGEHFVLIDGETLMHPDTRSFVFAPEIERDLESGIHPLFDSVNRTAVLTRWEKGADGNAIDMGALSALPDSAAIDVVAGFREMYGLIVRNRDEFLASECFRNLRSQRVRFLFRHTRIYDSILKRTLAADCLDNGVDRSIALDLLSRAFLTADRKPHTWPVLEAETERLAVLDIPLFATTCDSTALKFGVPEPIEDYFKQSGYDRCVEQILALSDEDLTFQESIINASFICKRVESGSGVIPTWDGPAASPASEELLTEVRKIGEELRSGIVRAKDGSARWTTFALNASLQRFQIEAVGDDLYSGQTGIGLFFAALYHATGDSADLELALDAISYMRSGNWRLRMAKYLNIGGMTGLGSIVYALVAMSRFLGVPDLLDDAAAFAALITPERIRSDGRFDVMSGAAGAALGLLALYGETSDSEVLNTAEACGRHVAESYEPNLTGFGHGAAGVAYAMLRLFDVTGNAEFQRVAEQAMDFERQLFSKEEGNWPDLRSTPPAFPVKWCHGAAGIGLGRLGSRFLMDNPAAKSEIAVAIQAAMDHIRDDVDHLCCGNAGRMEMLLTAGLRAEAESLAGWIISRRRQGQGYYLNADLPLGVPVPGLFQGISGIGYALLRLRSPERFPSVLLLEM